MKSNIAITEPIDFPKKGHVMNYPRDRADLCTFRILSVCELLYEFKTCRLTHSCIRHREDRISQHEKYDLEILHLFMKYLYD